jgi:hypothetical protein
VVEAYEFGKIEISGKTYRSDVIIYPDHVNAKWWRKQGHFLEIEDIQEVIEHHPEIIIIGTGQPGLMKVDEKALEKVHEMKIDTIVLPTEEACQEYNRVVEKKKAIACLHLTC